MRLPSSTPLVATLILASLGACQGLVESDVAAPPPPPAPGNGSASTGNRPPPPPETDPGVVIDPTIDPGVANPGTPGMVTPGTPPEGPPSPPAVVGTPCGDYPAAPELTATRFEVGSVVPNLSFSREDGTAVSFGEIRCDKKNKLMYWAVGGDNCGPCISTAKSTEIPAAKELGPQGLLVLGSLNGRRFLVSKSPWAGFRSKAQWPADGEHVMLLDEPTTKPYYVMGRVANGIPWVAVIDLETMKVVSRSRGSLASLRTLVKATPDRP